MDSKDICTFYKDLFFFIEIKESEKINFVPFDNFGNLLLFSLHLLKFKNKIRM